MCLTCGCELPYDKMSSDDNLTVDDIKKAVQTADAKGLSAEDAVKNLVTAWSKVKEEDKTFKA